MPEVFTYAYVTGLITGSVIRGIYTIRIQSNGEPDRRRKREPLLILPFFGMIVFPLIYVLSPWLDFANYRLPVWAGWGGVLLFAVGLWLLWRSHADLGRNWSPSLEIRKSHTLVTRGVFRHIRHPMYAAHLLWAVAQPLLLQNWIAGWAMLAAFVPVYLARVSHEEKMMIGHFGDVYREYMQRTGRILPHVWR